MNRLCIALAILALLAGVLPGPAAADEVGQKAQAVVQKQASTVATIRIVYDLEFAGQTREHRATTRGVVVADTGLILTALETVKPNINVRARGRAIEAKIKPADIKVVFEQDEKEWDAFVAVKDTKRGLAFLQLKNFKPADRKLQSVDFSKGVKPKVGDQVVTVHRLSKGYDYATYFTTTYVIGELKKPRKALMVQHGSLAGMPAFTLDGKLAGCHARMKPSIEEGQTRSQGTPVLLAVPEVNSVIKQALKKAAEGEQEETDEPEEESPKEEKP